MNSSCPSPRAVSRSLLLLSRCFLLLHSARYPVEKCLLAASILTILINLTQHLQGREKLPQGGTQSRRTMPPSEEFLGTWQPKFNPWELSRGPMAGDVLHIHSSCCHWSCSFVHSWSFGSESPPQAWFVGVLCRRAGSTPHGTISSKSCSCKWV